MIVDQRPTMQVELDEEVARHTKIDHLVRRRGSVMSIRTAITKISLLSVLYCVTTPVVDGEDIVSPSESDHTHAALALEMVSASGGRSGLCVMPACGSRELAAALVGHSDFYVHVLQPDDDQLRETRRAFSSTGEYGSRVSAERGHVSRLPYPDYCANLVVCDFRELPRERSCWLEPLRVTRPGGVAYLGQSASTAPAGRQVSAESLCANLEAAGFHDFDIVESCGIWARIRRPALEGSGDWGHGRWGTPGNNACVDDARVKAPFHTLWIGEPNGFTKFGLPVASGGRVLSRHGGITNEGRYQPSQQPDLIQVFDAYNGALLWQRRLDEPEGDGFVAIGDRVFAASRTTLYGLDAHDGSTDWRMRIDELEAGMKSWNEYRCEGGTLVARAKNASPAARSDKCRTVLVGLSPTDGSVQWKLHPDHAVTSFALGGERCFYSTGDDLVAIRIGDGEEVWRRRSPSSGIVRYHNGTVYTESASFAAADGAPGRRGNYRGVLVEDRLYSGGFKGLKVTDLATGETVPSFPVRRDPYCPKTGIPDGCSYMYGRCIMPTASTNCYFFSYGGTVIGDLIRNELFPCESVRANCRTGVIVGNGLVYNSPSGCGCSFQVRGGTALVPVDESLYWCHPRSKPPPQLEKGPAYSDEFADTDPLLSWPCFRHDPARSAVTETSVDWPVSPRWHTSLSGKLTPPIVASGMVFIGSDNHRVYALDARTGEIRWQFFIGSEIWASPAWWRGRLYFGSQDGWVHCLDARNGRVCWRFRGAPHDRKMIYYGRPQSLWPIAGGVVVEDGTVQFYAGRCSHDRVFVWSLDAYTGEVLWKNDQAGRAVEVTGAAGGISPHGVSPSGVLAASADILYVPQGPYGPAALAREDGRILWWGRRGNSTQRSNIEVQNVGGYNLFVNEDLLFVGGPNPVTGTSQPFVAVDANTGRMLGADDPRLFAAAGRDKTGRAVEVRRSMFGTKPIQFGQAFTPAVANDKVFIPDYRGGVFDLHSYLETQFGSSSSDVRQWPSPLPTGILIVAGDKVLIGSRDRLTAMDCRDGALLGHIRLPIDGAAIRDGIVVAEGSVFLVTTTGQVVSLSGVDGIATSPGS